MSRATFLVPLVAVLFTGCGGAEPPEAPVPDTVIRVDTITITREVDPPLPEGRTSMICLANGQNLEIRVSASGDTLIGPRRVRLTDLGPAVGFVGNYAADESWFVDGSDVTHSRTNFSRFGQPESRDCRGMKIVGDFNGVNLFADVASTAPFRVLYVPVRPGVFQSYQAQVGRVRG